MIKRIISIVETRYSLTDYNRFGVDTLRKNGFMVEVWDLTRVLHPKLFQSYVPPDVFEWEELVKFNNEGEIYNALSKLSDTDFIISFIGYNFENLKIYKEISGSRADYAICCANTLPAPSVRKKGLRLIISTLRKIAGYRRLNNWKHLIMKLPCRWLGVKPAESIIVGGTSRNFGMGALIDKNTEIVDAHAFDYDLYLNEKDISCGERSTAVFLDSFLPFHPDAILTNEKIPVSNEKYYGMLNDYFDYVEKKTGLEVVIAAHPRSDYENLPDYFKGRRRVKGRTAALVKESRLVLNHCSTAINFANLFYKPVIFLTCSGFCGTWEHYYIEEMARWFGKRPVFIDKKEDIDLESELAVSRPHYDNYRRAHIKTDDSEDLPFWQIFANRLKIRS